MSVPVVNCSKLGCVCQLK